MLLLVGLGNPGAKYARNRHNIGFMAVDAIAYAHGFGPEQKRFQGLTRDGVIETEAGRQRCLVLKPQTYMNDSGKSVQAAAAFFRMPVSDILVFHDELDLTPGRCRVKRGGGVAGHNGLRSIGQHLGPEFRRVRLGIGHPGREKVLSWVLEDFGGSERGWVETLCDAVARAAPLLVAGQDDAFQTKVSTLAPAPEVPAFLRGGKGQD